MRGPAHEAAPEEERDARYADGGGDADVAGGEPVLLVAAIEEVLQARDAGAQIAEDTR
jgi:hypothetical protein